MKSFKYAVGMAYLYSKTNNKINMKKSNKLKKLTVLIPCLNEEKGVAKVIRAVPKAKLKQLGYNVEILVIDNASTDNTSKVAKQT